MILGAHFRQQDQFNTKIQSANAFALKQTAFPDKKSFDKTNFYVKIFFKNFGSK